MGDYFIVDVSQGVIRVADILAEIYALRGARMPFILPQRDFEQTGGRKHYVSLF
jgi:hypothetical protein